MKSIKGKLMLVLMTMTFLVCVCLGTGAFVLAVIGMGSTVKRDITAYAEQTAYSVQLVVEEEKRILNSIASMEYIENSDIPLEQKLAILSGETESIGCLYMGIADLNGKVSYTNGTTADISTEQYFLKALDGESYISDPIVDSTDESLIMTFAAPIVFEGKTTGVLVQTMDGSIMGQVVNGKKFGETGRAFLINTDGVIIGHQNIENVKNQYNPLKASTEKTMVSAFEKMLAKDSGTARYVANGEKENLGFAKVAGTNWIVGVTIKHDEVYKPLVTQMYQIITATILLTCIAGIIVSFLSKRLAKQIVLTTGYLQTMAEGDFTVEVEEEAANRKDEFGIMANGINQMKDSIGTIVKTIQTSSEELEDKSTELTANSEAISDLSETITDAITEIAQGTSFQANELIAITDVLDSFNEKLVMMTNQVDDVDETSKKIDSMAVRSTGEMNELNESVGRIRTTFNTFETSIYTLNENITRINEMTNLITDVANQTNLLALNASIEAARAGEAGRGFAVVAEEIGSLAEQSKSSSVKINELLGGITQNTDVLVKDAKEMGIELNDQIKTIHRSMETFKFITENIADVIPKIRKIKESGSEIMTDKDEILEKIDELSSVSEEISASSEEISASAEEMNQSISTVAESAKHLSGMTEEMSSQVNRFTVE